MNKEIVDKPILKSLSGEQVSHFPVWLMRQAGRYLPEYREIRKKAGSFLDLCYNPELAAEVTLQPIKRFNLDAAILFSDILVLPHALGINLRYEEGKGPILDPVRNRSDIEKLEGKKINDTLEPIYKTIKRVKLSLPKNTALIGFAGAPWTVTTYMIEGSGSKDFRNAKNLMWSDEKSFEKLIDILVKNTAKYLISQADAGAEILQIFDSWAGILPSKEFEKYVIEPTAKIVKVIKYKYPNIPIIGFPKGAGLMIKKYQLETGVDCIGLDPTIPLEFAEKELQPNGCVQGNLDPILLRSGGGAMEKEVIRIKKILGNGQFIANLGHGILPDTPIEHVSQFVEMIRS